MKECKASEKSSEKTSNPNTKKEEPLCRESEEKKGTVASDSGRKQA